MTNRTSLAAADGFMLSSLPFIEIMEFEIPDADLTGFNEQARARLRTVAVTFTEQLVEEANRIEAGRNSAQGDPEITSSMVHDAELSIRRGLGNPKKSWGTKILRIAGAVLSLLVGIIYNATKLQGPGYMFLFIAVVTAAIICVTISTLND
jgi:hypothetical protein